MANKNEAKITFSAETSQFNTAIKSANSSMSTLRAELKLNSTQLKGTGDQVQMLQQRSQLLSQQLEQQQAKTAALTEKQQAAVRIYGENSEEAAKLTREIIYSQEAEEKIGQEIEKTNQQLNDQISAESSTEESFESLSEKIEQQEQWLSNLNAAYDNAVSEYGETSSEAQNLKGQIDSLSSSLDENKSKLEGVSQSTGEAGEKMEELSGDGEVSEEMFGLIDKAAGDFGINAVASVGGVIAAAEELYDKLVDVKAAWDNAKATISQGTGASGANLAEMEDLANEVFQDYSFSDMELEDVAAALAEVNTRFLYTGDTLKDFTLEVAEFAKVTGSDAISATDMLAENTTQWGDACMDTTSLMEALTVAGQASGQSANTLGQALADNALQFQQLGMSQEEAITQLVNWTWAGNDASTYSAAMTKAFQKLNGEVDDVPGTFEEAVDIIENWDGSLADLMDYTIPSTCTSIEELAAAEENAGLSAEELQKKSEESGLTIADVFGKSSQDVIQGFQTTAANADKLGFSLETMNQQYQDTISNSISSSDAVNQLGRNAANAAANMGYAESSLSDYTYAAEAYSDVLKGVGKTSSKMSSEVTDDMDDIASASSDAFGDVSADATDAASDAKSTFKSAAKQIKSDLNISPDIKVTATIPKFSLKGSFSAEKGTVPTVSVKYSRAYAKAMDRAYVLDGLTPFGVVNGGVAYGGESGREVITGEDYLERTVRDNSVSIDYAKIGQATANAFASMNFTMKVGERDFGKLVREVK